MPSFADYRRLPSLYDNSYGPLMKIVDHYAEDKSLSSKHKTYRPPRLRLPRPTRRNLAILVIAILVVVGVATGIWRGASRRTRPVPSPAGLASYVVTLYDNDLFGRASDRKNDSAVLLSQPVTHRGAQKQCAAIGEKLLNITNRSPDTLLQYMNYLDNGTRADANYWVAEKTGSLCNAITHDGLLEHVDCQSNITTLCSQSALISREWDQDSSDKWRIEITSGNQSFTGYRDRLGFRFQGIRYAKQPKRFKHSKPYTIAGHTDALRPGPRCNQRGGGSEDCLFMNIFTPFLPLNGSTSTALKPVMFWLHGGAFEIGDGADPMSDGGNLASRGDVVVVTHNYRLGTLGFLAMNDSATRGNYGLGDQITALDWVHSNIRSFGGDPTRTTIFGQSAGAASVRALLGSPKAIGKYSAAIMQSNLGGYDFAEPYTEYYNNSVIKTNFTNAVLNDTNCAASKSHRSQLKCLRKFDAQQMADLPTQASYLAVDGEYLVQPHLMLNTSGPTAHVPLLMGSMSDDAVLFLAPEDTQNANLTRALSSNTFNTSVLAHPDDFPLDPHPLSATRAVYNVTVRAGNDAMFRCVDHATTYAAAHHSVAPTVYSYVFGRAYMNYDSRPACNPPVTWDRPDGDPELPYLKCHSGDLIYVFGNLAFRGWVDRDGYDVRFAQAVVDMWSSFAWRHDPNPDPVYLKARGYSNTTEWLAGVMGSGGPSSAPLPWKPVNATGDGRRMAMRVLQRQAVNVPFDEGVQCEDLGLPLDMFA